MLYIKIEYINNIEYLYKIMEDNSEIYIFLGTQNNTHFFIHVIFNTDEFKKEFSYQIYNSLVSENFIINKNENVIIYEFNPKTNNCDIIAIQHISKIERVIFHKNNLENFFASLINTPRNDIYAIKYNYDLKVYLSYYVNNSMNIMENIKFPLHDLIIDNMYDVISKKPIE